MEIVGHEIVVAVVLDGTNKGAESIYVAESSLLDLLENLDEVRVHGVGTVVVSVAEILNILSQVAEEEDVILANLTSDFNLSLVSG